MKRYRVKPGKGVSAVSLTVGVLFVLLGIFVVIPTTGLFGLIWTAIAAVGVFTSAANIFSEKGVASSEVIVEDDADLFKEKKAEPEEDAAERLRKAEELYQQGLLTYEEYQKKRAEIIDSI